MCITICMQIQKTLLSVSISGSTLNSTRKFYHKESKFLFFTKSSQLQCGRNDRTGILQFWIPSVITDRVQIINVWVNTAGAGGDFPGGPLRLLMQGAHVTLQGQKNFLMRNSGEQWRHAKWQGGNSTRAKLSHKEGLEGTIWNSRTRSDTARWWKQAAEGGEQ